DHQEAARGDGRRIEATHRRGGRAPAAGAAGAEPAVRLRLHHGRQSRDARRPARQAQARERDRARRVGTLTLTIPRRISMRRLAWVLVLALLAPLPAWAQTIKLGAVVPLTGRYGPGGAQVRAGYEIAVEQINAAGGVTVGGKKTPLELVLLDD